ncbi:hypothetical protein Tco_0739416 [Tanacetum coccineum]
MSTQQDIYVVGSENRPHMLNKENYVPWSSRLLRYAKSRPNGNLIYNSIINGPYVSEMISLNQTILLGLPKDIYAAVDSCKTAQEIWLRVQQMMKGSDIGIQEKKAKLFNEWESQHVTIVHQTKDLHIVDYTQLYDFLKYNQKKVNELRAERLAKAQDPLALMANFNNPFNYTVLQPGPIIIKTFIQQPSTQQQLINPQSSFTLKTTCKTNYAIYPKDITDPYTVMNMALVLMAKAFKLNYSTPTNNNQRISSNPQNRQIAQPGMNLGQDNQMQMVGGNGGINLDSMLGRMLANQNRNGNVIAARAEGNAIGSNDLDEIEEVNANCILMANLQQASTSGTQSNKAPVYDSDGSTENDSNVTSAVSSVEQGRGTVEQHPANVEETRVLYDSLYNNLAIEVEKVNSVNRKLRETNVDLTTELARYKNQEKCFEISQEKYDKLESLSKEKSQPSSLQEEKKRLKSDFKIREDELLDK